jgi:hypothetical protein
MGKRRFRSMADAEAAWRAADRLHGLFMLALHDVMAGKVRWHQRAVFRLGVSRADGAHGGVVIVEYTAPGQSPYVEVHYLDDWAAHVLGKPPSSDPDDVALWDLTRQAKALRDELVREAVTCTR